MVKKITLLIFLSGLFCGCANPALNILEKKQQNHYEAIIQTYENALMACRAERILVEEQYIAEQKKNYFILNVIAKTDKKDMKEYLNSAVLTYEDVRMFETEFNAAKKDSIKKIDDNFKKFFEKIDAELQKEKSLNSAIAEIRQQRYDNWKGVVISSGSAAAATAFFLMK